MESAGLPLHFSAWLYWMFFVIVLAPIVFIARRQGRIVLIFSAVFLVVQLPLSRAVGLTNLLSLPHILIWTPLVIYLLRELHARRIEPVSPFGIWALTASGTAIISLVFDVRDFSRWIGGERDVVNPPPLEQTAIPWLWVTLIMIALGASTWYVFKSNSGTQEAKPIS
ncbi:MAG: hypothetical protein AB7R40_22050 [Nitrospiraceae bacterium]